MKSRKTHSGSRAICTYSQNGREPRQREIKARPFHGPSAGDKVCAFLKKQVQIMRFTSIFLFWKAKHCDWIAQHVELPLAENDTKIAPAVQSPTRSGGLHPANQDSFTNSAKATKLDSFSFRHAKWNCKRYFVVQHIVLKENGWTAQPTNYVCNLVNWYDPFGDPRYRSQNGIQDFTAIKISSKINECWKKNN